MPRDGAGNFALNAGYLAIAGQVIQPSQHNPPLEDLATGLSDSIARTGVTAVTADIPFGGFKLTSVGDATADTDALNRQTADGRYIFIGSGLTRGLLSGLGLSNNVTDATNDIDVASGMCIDSTNTDNMTIAATITKRLDAAWAVGTGNGGLDTGAIANAWYHVFVIKRVDTGVVDVLFSLSATAPTMPASYTLFRRIGSVFRTSGALKPFTQLGKQFLWKTAPVLDWNAVSPGTSPGTNYVLSVPPGVQVNADIRALWIGGSLSYNKVRSPDVTASVASSSDFDCATDTVTTIATTPLSVRTNTSAQVFASTTTALTTVSIVTAGWCEI